MATYLIIYDTKKEATAYHAHDKQITDAIKSISDVYWNHLDNTYLIVSALSASRIKDKLSKHLTNEDKVLVVKVDAGNAAWSGFPEKASNWLHARA
ncbi:MAG TPA: hypothetical protein VNR65_04710 [Geobacterales bacterium]|nr:hypothetical protein [Geobacterales bacterium]